MKGNALLLFLMVPFLLRAQLTYHTGFGLGNTGQDDGNAIVVDQSGNVYAAGTYQFWIDLDPGPGTSVVTSTGATDIFLAKYTASGQLVWGKTFGSSGDDEISGMDMDDSGNIYLIGYFSGTIDFGGGILTGQAGSRDFYVAKMDENGQHIWSKRFGGAGDDNGNSIRVNGSGTAIAICGSFQESMTLGSSLLISNASSGYSNAFVALLNGNGDVQWAYAFGGSGFVFDRAMDVAMNQAGTVYVIGNFSGSNVDIDPGTGAHLLTSNGSSDIFVVWYNAAGTFQDGFSIGGSTGELGGGIDVDTDGSIYITGYSNSDSIDVDPQSGTAWLTGESGILYVQDLIVVKYNSNGEYQWGFRTGKRATDSGQDIKTDGKGNLFVTGITGDANVDFDPGTGTHYLSGDSMVLTNSVAFLAQYSTDGSFVDAFTLTGVGSGRALAVSDNGKVWLTGYYRSGAIGPDPVSPADTISNAGSWDVFVAGYRYPVATGVRPQEEHLSVSLVPAGDFVIVKGVQNLDSRIAIYDMTGKAVRYPRAGDNGKISLEGLRAGVYFISMESPDKFFITKVIKLQ
ncbi:MAG: lipoprotein [Chitinophagales bacterium]|nr:MAG: lipoprotein [Chitinophagales bacterium]